MFLLYRLALLELQESSVFEGLQRRLFLTYNLRALKDRKYYEAGVLIGWSLAQGGPGPRCLHPTLFQVCMHVALKVSWIKVLPDTLVVVALIPTVC